MWGGFCVWELRPQTKVRPRDIHLLVKVYPKSNAIQSEIASSHLLVSQVRYLRLCISTNYPDTYCLSIRMNYPDIYLPPKNCPIPTTHQWITNSKNSFPACLNRFYECSGKGGWIGSLASTWGFIPIQNNRQLFPSLIWKAESLNYRQCFHH